MNEQDQTLHLDVINEDPARPGPIGSAQVPLYTVFESKKFEDWVPLTTSAGGPLGHIYIRVSFEVRSQPRHMPYTLIYPNPFKAIIRSGTAIFKSLRFTSSTSSSYQFATFIQRTRSS